MGVTRLERKGRKNKTVAKVRVATIKRLKRKITIASPNREESGKVIGGVEDVLSSIKSAPAKKSAPKAAKEDASKASAEKKAAPKAKKADKAEAAAEKAPAKKAAPKKAKEDKADDLTKIEGIGPKMAGVFGAAGVDSYATLAGKTSDELRAILDKAEGNFAAHDPGTWPEQAQMAADGKWDELKKWQDELDGGK